MNFDFDFGGAEAEYRRALELAPQNPSATTISPSCWPLLAGSTKPSRSTSGRLCSIHYAAGSQLNLAVDLTALGRYDEAEAAVRKGIALQPQSSRNYMQLARIQILRGQPAAALALAKQETDPFWRTYALALAYFAHGDRAEADAQLKKLIDEDANDAGSQIARSMPCARSRRRCSSGWSTPGRPTTPV